MRVENTQKIISRFDEIYNSTHKDVLSFIASKCGNAADINDIAQETYLELYRLLSKRGTDYVQNDKAVVIKIARQKLSRYYSVMERLKLLVPLVTANEDGEEVMLSDLEANAFLAEDFTNDRLLIENARQFIKAKPEDVKKIFYLFYDVDLQIPEIAKALSMSESGVKNKLYRTLKELRELLK
jgi:RNA polymerase sigma-70 factor (ECF subfamily)